MAFVLETFVPETLQENDVSLIIGRRKCGKYSLLKDLLYHLRFRFQHNYHASSLDPSHYKLTCQEACVFDSSHFSFRKPLRPTCAVVQYSQCSKDLDFVIRHNRHLLVSLFLSFQTLRRFYIEDEVRYIFCFRTNHSDLSFLYKRFFTDVFESFELYQSTIVNLQPYECLVLDTLTLRCYKYKASIDIPEHILHEDCPDRTLCDDNFKLRSTLVNMLCVRRRKSVPQAVANLILDFLHPAKHSCCLK